MMAAVTSGLTTVIGWVGSFVSALTGGELAELMPLLAIGVSVSALMLGIRVVRSVIWGS